jgi:multidrug efflux pump subunit AcrB
MPTMAVIPRIPAGHFIPWATSRYEAAPPLVMAVTMQLILMIHLFMASFCYTLTPFCSVLISIIATFILCQPY